MASTLMAHRQLQRLLGAVSTSHERPVVAGLVIGLALVGSLMLILPGRTVSAIYAQDVMVFLDGAHRVLSGQVPSRDFHTPIGPLAYLLPALGLLLTGSLGATMPVATAIFMLMLAPVLIHVCATRLPLLLALIVSIYVCLLVLAPLNPGELPNRISFAMFYNRFGWAALGLLFLLYAPRKDGHGSTDVDALCAGFLFVLLIFLKASYAVVALAFLIGLVLVPGTRRIGLGALLIGCACVALAEAIWSVVTPYASDLAFAAAASGAVRNGVVGLSADILRNTQSIVLFLAVLAIAWAVGLRARDVAACGLMGLAGLILINQNAQEHEIATLVPAAVVATRLSGVARPSSTLGWPDILAVVLTLALAAQQIVASATALVVHTAKAARPAPASDEVAVIDGLIASERLVSGTDIPTRIALRRPYDRGSTDLGSLNFVKRLERFQPLAQTEYFWTIEDGLALLEREPQLAGTVFVLDTANPFNVLLRRTPPRGDSSWHHVDRTFSTRRFVPAKDMFSDVSVVLDPKNPVAFSTAYGLRKIYGRFIEQNFVLTSESSYWRAYVRKGGRAQDR